MNFEIAVFEYLNYLLVLICFLFDLINEPASLDSEDVKQAFHHVAVELVGHGPCALNKHFRGDGTDGLDDLELAVLKSGETEFGGVGVL